MTKNTQVNKLKRKTVTCPNCGERAYIVPDWNPKPGFEPKLRLFICTSYHCKDNNKIYSL